MARKNADFPVFGIGFPIFTAQFDGVSFSKFFKIIF